jgi:hypothetical protein
MVKKTLNQTLRTKQIANLLRTALVEGGQMHRSLYEYELEEHIDYWYAGLKADKDEFVFVVTENTGHVAMALILSDKTLYINDEARAKLMEFWPQTYRANLIRLIPKMAADLASGHISVNGVKTVGIP